MFHAIYTLYWWSFDNDSINKWDGGLQIKAFNSMTMVVVIKCQYTSNYILSLSHQILWRSRCLFIVQREWTFVKQDFRFLFHEHFKYLHRSSIIVILCVKPSNCDLLIFDQFSPSNLIIAFPIFPVNSYDVTNYLGGSSVACLFFLSGTMNGTLVCFVELCKCVSTLKCKYVSELIWL